MIFGILSKFRYMRKVPIWFEELLGIARIFAEKYERMHDSERIRLVRIVVNRLRKLDRRKLMIFLAFMRKDTWDTISEVIGCSKSTLGELRRQILAAVRA